jgi:hypothetical protein
MVVKEPEVDELVTVTGQLPTGAPLGVVVVPVVAPVDELVVVSDVACRKALLDEPLLEEPLLLPHPVRPSTPAATRWIHLCFMVISCFLLSMR